MKDHDILPRFFSFEGKNPAKTRDFVLKYLIGQIEIRSSTYFTS